MTFAQLLAAAWLIYTGMLIAQITGQIRAGKKRDEVSVNGLGWLLLGLFMAVVVLL